MSRDDRSNRSDRSKNGKMSTDHRSDSKTKDDAEAQGAARGRVLEEGLDDEGGDVENEPDIGAGIIAEVFSTDVDVSSDYESSGESISKGDGLVDRSGDGAVAEDLEEESISAKIEESISSKINEVDTVTGVGPGGSSGKSIEELEINVQEKYEDKQDKEEKKERKDFEEKQGETRRAKRGKRGGQDGAFARGRGFVEGMVPDGLKKLFVAGLGALATGEEGARRVATDLSLPKEAVGYLLSQAQTTKKELFRIIAGELRSFLENVNIGAELQRILTSLTFEVTMQIRLKPSKNDNGVRPQVKSRVKVVPQKRERKKERDEEQ